MYVDADQVMRVDINELWEMDIHDHVYAYTPLCTSNPETKGFMVVFLLVSNRIVLDTRLLEGSSSRKTISY